MTGEGTAQGTIGNRHYEIEIRTVNHRFAEIHLSLPPELRAYELRIRNLLLETLQRGTIRCWIRSEWLHLPEMPIQEEVLKETLHWIVQHARQWQIPVHDPWQIAMQFPGIFTSERETLSEEEWTQFQTLLNQAIEQTLHFRQEEGKKIHTKLNQLLDAIETTLQQIDQEEQQRNQYLHQKLPETLSQIKASLQLTNTEIEPGRLEQELLYYILRMDFSEEKDRLRAHLSAFREKLTGPPPHGKTLNFLCQEMHREITTLSNKAQWAPIHHLAVQIKEYIEALREHVQNIV